MRHTIFGESHGPAIGVVLEQVPAGIELDQQEIAREMGPGARRGTVLFPRRGRKRIFRTFSPVSSRAKPQGLPCAP